MKIAKPGKKKLSPSLQKQLKQLLDWNGPDFTRKLHVRDTLSPDYLASEILVMALREAWVANEAEWAEEIATEILERWGKFILKSACKRFPVTAQEWIEIASNRGILGDPSSANLWLATGKRAEMLQEVYSRLWERLKDRSKHDWERYFFPRLRFLCLDVAMSMGYGSWSSSDPLLDKDYDEQNQEIADETLTMEDALVQADSVSTALGMLPPKQATAVYLTHVLGWSISGEGTPKGFTVSKAMGITDRMVRIHLKAAKRTLGIHFAEEMGL